MVGGSERAVAAGLSDLVNVCSTENADIAYYVALKVQGLRVN